MTYVVFTEFLQTRPHKQKFVIITLRFEVHESEEL